MKTWNSTIPTLAAAALMFCAGFFTTAQDKRFSHIPDAAALVIRLDLDKLNSSPAFRELADSGVLASVRDGLKQIPWTENGALPDPVVVFAPDKGAGCVMLIETDKTPKELAEKMTALYGDDKSVEHTKYALGDTVTVNRIVTKRKNKRKLEMESRIVYLSPGIAAFGRENSPLSYRFFEDGMIPADELADLEMPAPDVVAAGILRSFPVPASDDPTGLSALVKTGAFTLSEQESGDVSLVLAFECRGEKEAALAARRMKSFVRIALVSLFAADKPLFKMLNSSCKTTGDGNMATLEISLSKDSVDKIRAFYGFDRMTQIPAATPAAEQEDVQK